MNGTAKWTAALWALGWLVPTPGNASVFASDGVRTTPITVCFVGDAVTSRPARVLQILTYIREYEFAVNIQFQFLGACPPPTTQANGNDFYDGDIRINIPNTSVDFTNTTVPGKGCTGVNPSVWGSYSNFPNDLPKVRMCMYNMHLGDDGSGGVPYLNHTLHEFGHALGLAHEHQRSDATSAICAESGFGGGISTGFLTGYDRNSVMNYQFLTCGINGNYANTGLSDLDRLGVHILYPETEPVAEFIGTTVVRAADPVILHSAWGVRGANLAFVAHDFHWVIPGLVAVTSPDLTTSLPPGTYTLEFTYVDFLGRSYSFRGTVRVLLPAAYTQQIAAPVAALLPLL